MLTLKKVKEMVKAPAHTKRVPSPKVLLEEGRIFLRKEFEHVDTGIRIESAADLRSRCLDDVATDVLYMTGNDHALEAADPLELAEIKRRWEPYINQLPDYAYLCKDLLNRKM